MTWELFAYFMLVSLLAFGGGQAALPLIERVAVAERHWINSQDFAAASGLGYVTPGPILITATFIGYRAGGLPGALAATMGVFLMPWLLAALAAHILRPFLGRPWLHGFGVGAAPAVVGLLGITAVSLARHAFTHWGHVVVAAIAFLLAARTKIHPVVILAGGTLLALLLIRLPPG